MKKNYVAMSLFTVVFAVGTIFVNSEKEVTMNELMKANMEALAGEDDPMTSEEFTLKTGCVAVWENVICLSPVNGNKYSFASVRV